MFATLGTPAEHQRKTYEFTPIGHIQEKENMDAQKLRPMKRSTNEEDEDISFDGTNFKKSRVIDDTMTSQRLFNDTSFDDTLPEQTINAMTSIKKNLVPELLGSDTREKADLASNPLKEQQNALQKLNMENYSLRVKCNSLLKFLNNVTDDGQLRKSLEILDELQEWKTKHHELLERFKDLQVRFDGLEQKDTENAKVAEPVDHSYCDSMRKELEAALADTNQQILTLTETIKNLEAKLKATSKDYEAREEQYKMNIDVLKSEINQLNSSFISKQEALAQAEEKVNRLRNQLQEFDHNSGSLLELEKKIDEKNQGIRNLESKLQELNHQRQNLERQLQTSDGVVNSLKNEYEKYKNDTENKLNSYQKSASADENKLREKMEILEKDNSKLSKMKDSLEQNNREFDVKLKKAEKQIQTLERERERILSEQQDAIHDLRLEHQKRVQSLHKEVSNLREMNSKLEGDNQSYKKRFEQLVKPSPHRKSTEDELIRKNREIGTLKATLRDLEDKIKYVEHELESVHSKYRREKALLEAKLAQADREKPLESNLLEKEISILKLELNSIQDTKEREIALWENKYESLKQTYENMLKQDRNNDFNNILEQRREELKSLMRRYNDLTTENLSLTKELNKQKSHKESYKEDLKKVQSRLDFITKEFVKIKEANPDGKELDGVNSKWTEKYQSMKTKMLNELKSLQDENLELERKFLNLQKQQQQPIGSTPMFQHVNDSNLQDKLDYYRLKYHEEVRRNNDFKVINEYLNRVLKASSHHVKLDIIKLENEVSPLNSSVTYLNDQPYEYENPYYTKGGRSLKFKTVALMVLSCVRMHQAALKRRWDQQRTHYLQRKITFGEDRITW
ncbi:Spc110p Ecym_5514 [Eremothecium cymbalariae DBVPG|uniref:Spindle pole body component 110 n=1 Tax=Eremothecium cymbalariae (strain CBS 270.75 / DBVPG 7215 / KCTC 17166 / NRRL Y-17582) TaxID=931890 RepID=I6NDW4_ERECY|nr:hypothetical protein Ecym_5514 [Eremothecium cymbalariae DBVPG\